MGILIHLPFTLLLLPHFQPRHPTFLSRFPNLSSCTHFTVYCLPLSYLISNLLMYETLFIFKIKRVNSRWGIVAFPTLILFGKGDAIAKCNNRSYEGMIKFLSDRTSMFPSPHFPQSSSAISSHSQYRVPYSI